MEMPGSGYTHPLYREWDYRKAATSIANDFRANGTLDLPLGPDRLLFAGSSGWWARAIERWQMGFILWLSDGAPRNFKASNMLYANGRPDVAGPWNNLKGKVQWEGDNGYFFGSPSPFASFADPQCSERVGGSDAHNFNLQGNCSLLGLARVVEEGTPGAIPISSGRYGIPVLQHPLPGQQGTLGAYTLNTHGKWALDANISKTFRLTEFKSLQLRVDARNVLNHPTPADPTGLTGGTEGSSFNENLGQITSKSGSRTFQGHLRFSF
jgi:hypothetical protein